MLVYDSVIIKDGFLGSNRKIDENGYLKVKACNLTKEQVAGYLGKEIPNWKEFNLEENKIYYVYRPEYELAKAVESFNNLPLTREHIEIDTENVPKDKIVGSLGDHAEYKSPYIKNSLIVYDQHDIDNIMNGKKKELSCGYRYTPVRQEGEWGGQHYDFVMTNIIGNHVALVREGRAGHDVMVADEKPDFASEQENDIIEEKDNKMFFDKLLAKDEFKESEHPRAKNGQFTSKGGSGSSGSKMEFSEYRNAAGEKTMRASFEHNGAKVDAIKEGKYVSMWIYAPEGKKFDNGDTFYTTEAEADKAEELAKKIIDTEFGGSGEAKKEGMTPLQKRNEEFLSKYEIESKVKYKGKEVEINNVDLDSKQIQIYDPDERRAKWVLPKDLDEEGSESKKESSDKFEIKKPNSKKAVQINKEGDIYRAYYGQYIRDFEDEPYSFELFRAAKEFKTEKGAIKWANEVLELDSSTTNYAIPDEQDKPETAGEEKAEKEDKTMEKEKKESLAEDKCAKDEKVDKRKLIDEIGGILKDKVDDEIIRTIMGKAEELAYEGSEAGEADDAEIKTKEQKEDFAEGVAYGEKKEKEEPKKLDSEHESEGMKKEEEKKAEDKCAKDSALAMDIDSIKAEVRAELIEDFKAREEARKNVKPVIGDINVMAFDSCGDIYKMACEKAGLNVQEVVSYKDAFVGFMAGKSKLAMDATPVSSGNEECFKDIRV